MDWKDISPLVAAAAPTIGQILGATLPIPGASILLPMAGKFLAEALGVPPTPEAVNTAITTGDPSVVAAKLSEAEAKTSAEVEKFKAALADVQDARATTIELTKVGSNIAWGAPTISVVIVIGFFMVMSMLFVVKVDLSAGSVTLLNVLFGALIPAFGQVCNYWLGSSAGSENKSQQIATLAGAPPPVVKKK